MGIRFLASCHVEMDWWASAGLGGWIYKHFGLNKAMKGCVSKPIKEGPSFFCGLYPTCNFQEEALDGF